MLSKEDIQKNKEEFIGIVKEINREGVDELLAWLETTDFFRAPASTKFHSNFEGGLCKHSLNVYHTMMKLKNDYCPEISDESCKIVALFHDIAKVNFYEEYAQNKKVYSPNGSKYDELGKFDWVAVKSYRVKSDADKEFVCHTHGVNSYMILHRFIKITQSEAAAIMNHHSGADDNFAVKDISEVLNRYPTATLLHMADYLATFILENPYMVDE